MVSLREAVLVLGIGLVASLAHAQMPLRPAEPGREPAAASQDRPPSALPARRDVSVSQARREVGALLQTMYRGEFNEGWRPMERITTYPLRNVKLQFRDLQPIAVSSDHPHHPSGAWYAGPANAAAGCMRKCGNFFWMERADAERFARALNVLIAAAREGSRDDYDEFRAVAAQWRALERKPPLSDEANRHRILAEHALQQNDLAAASAHYEDALEKFPGWPEGWMNAALLCEALKDYRCAADRMRHFLELLPNSREAAAAREKLVLWQELARR